MHRRRFLTTGTAVGIGLLAGCLVADPFSGEQTTTASTEEPPANGGDGTATDADRGTETPTDADGETDTPAEDELGPGVGVAKLLASDGERGDHFGRAVSISGNTALVGAIYPQLAYRKAGAAYVFSGSGGS